jgi:ketosteroid isomerase-like protein
VDRAGEAAILTYNLVSYGRRADGGAVVARWNSTAVYRLIDGRWKILHSHWSFTRPELKVSNPQ